MNSDKVTTVGCEEIMVRRWLEQGGYAPQEREDMCASYLASSSRLRLHGRLKRFAGISWILSVSGFLSVIACVVFNLWIPYSVYVLGLVMLLSFAVACILEIWKKTIAPSDSIALTIFNDIEAFEREFDIDTTVLPEEQVREKIVFRFLMLERFSARYSNHPDLVQTGVAQLKWVQSLVVPFYDLEELCGNRALFVERD
jgi:hypothetical protein